MNAMNSPHTDRRAFLRIGGITVLGLAGAACSGSETSSSSESPSSSAASSSSSPSSAAPASTEAPLVDSSFATAPPTSAAVDTTAAASAALTAASFEGLGTCSLMPEKTAGPFPLDQQFDRRDITEGAPGQPMRLGLRVLDQSCAAVPGAKVEIWHCDSTGDYSAFTDNGGGKDDAAGTTFLRGTQTADDNGIVEFLTVYPGWYHGRAVHIHLRVHLDDATVLTSQMFFDSDYTAGVYAGAPYAEFGLPDTSNQADGIAGNPDSEGTLLHTSAGETSKGAGTVGLLNLGIDPST
jgi:protocatechuate 3,4-dioxygenase beta subunit